MNAMLKKVQDELGKLAHQYDVEFVPDPSTNPEDDSVYLNYDFNVAVMIIVRDEQYELTAMHWDETHAVDDMHDIALIADAWVAALVAVEWAKAMESL